MDDPYPPIGSRWITVMPPDLLRLDRLAALVGACEMIWVGDQPWIRIPDPAEPSDTGGPGAEDGPQDTE